MTTIKVFNFIPSAEPDDERTKIRTTTINICQTRGNEVEHCEFGVAFQDTIDECGSLKGAIDELIRDSQHMFSMLKMKEMSVEYPANLEGAEFETFKTKIQSGIPSVKLIFKKSEWIHTVRGWVKVSELPVVDAAPMICSSSTDTPQITRLITLPSNVYKVISFRNTLENNGTVADAIYEIQRLVGEDNDVNIQIEYPANIDDQKMILQDSWSSMGRDIIMKKSPYLWTHLGWVREP